MLSSSQRLWAVAASLVQIDYSDKTLWGRLSHVAVHAGEAIKARF